MRGVPQNDELLPDRVFAAEVLPRERFIDDDRRIGASAAIVARQRAAAQQRDAEGLEVRRA